MQMAKWGIELRLLISLSVQETLDSDLHLEPLYLRYSFMQESTPPGGAMHTFDSINHYFLIGQMIIPGSNHWNIGIGRAKGEVEQDEEALRTMEALGQNMAWLLKKIHAWQQFPG